MVMVALAPECAALSTHCIADSGFILESTDIK